MCTSVLGCLQGGLVKVLPCGPYGPAAVLGHCRLFSPMWFIAARPGSRWRTGSHEMWNRGPGVSKSSSGSAFCLWIIFAVASHLLFISQLWAPNGSKWAHHVARLVAQHPPPLLPFQVGTAILCGSARSALACNWGRFLDLAGLLPFSQIEQVRRFAGNIEHPECDLPLSEHLAVFLFQPLIRRRTMKFQKQRSLAICIAVIPASSPAAASLRAFLGPLVAYSDFNKGQCRTRTILAQFGL